MLADGRSFLGKVNSCIRVRCFFYWLHRSKYLIEMEPGLQTISIETFLLLLAQSELSEDFYPPLKRQTLKMLFHKTHTRFAPVAAGMALLFLAAASFLSVPVFAQSVPHSSHVILVIEENRSYTTVTNSADPTVYMPWLVGKGTAYGHATNYITNTTGSAMAYFWMSSGSCHASVNCTLPPGTHDFNCGGNGCFNPTTGAVNPIQDDSIFRELDRAGISWKVYAETLPSVGYTGGNSGAYTDRH